MMPLTEDESAVWYQRLREHREQVRRATTGPTLSDRVNQRASMEEAVRSAAKYHHDLLQQGLIQPSAAPYPANPGYELALRIQEEAEYRQNASKPVALTATPEDERAALRKKRQALLKEAQ